MDVQRHHMADEDQRCNYVHKYTTGLHPHHPYDAVVYSYDIKRSKLNFNMTHKGPRTTNFQGPKKFRDQKFQGKSVQGPKQSKQNKQKVYSNQGS